MKIAAYKKILLAFIGILGWLAAEGQAQPDSLYQYMVIAAKNNPAILQKFNEYQAALQKVPQVGGLQDPEFNLGVFIQPMELVAGNQVADLRLMQMFPWFGTLKAAKDEMSLMAKAKYESFRDAKLQLFFNVKRSWYELLATQNEIRISEENIEILHTIERLTLAKYKAAPTGERMDPSAEGAGLADLYRIQIETGDLENNIALLKSQLTTIMARFNSFLNRPSLSPVQLPPELTPDSLGISLTSVTDSVLAHNPMLSMLAYEQQSLDARKKMVTRMGNPMIGLGIDYSIISKSDMSTSSMNGRDMVMPMATLTLPIYRGKYNAMKRETEFLKTASNQNYQATVNSLQAEYYEAAQLFKDGQRRIKLYENQSFLAQRTLDILLKIFSTEGIPLTDILRIRQQTLDYEIKKIEAIADYNLAISWLQRLMATSDVE
jgi:outer membrane protein TolC